ncbi:mate efflux family protein [Aspergillus ellipticus CBS 707.79]|uniref:Mate efflux family protein n=1 Tax=Aspergillus ellipticus CBS 707.79 TaxID=1448320 RepID=A0A319EXJ9_9EURO|nr:mate efflux family protein [Aspergillus ellipticus CBS 707.79]
MKIVNLLLAATFAAFATAAAVANSEPALENMEKRCTGELLSISMPFLIPALAHIQRVEKIGLIGVLDGGAASPRRRACSPAALHPPRLTPRPFISAATSAAQHSMDDSHTPLLGSQSREESPNYGLWAELWLLLRQSVPLIITYLLQFLPYVLTTLIAGRLGADDLAAASISGTIVAICGSAFMQGLATALDTLCAQTYGAGNKIGVGIHVQRLILLMTATCVPIGALWFLSPSLLPLIVKQPNLAVKAGSFLRISVIGLPGQVFYETSPARLQNRHGYCPGLHTIECMELNGAALGSATTQLLRSILLLGYIVRFAKWSHGCWGGLSREAFTNWPPMVVLSVAGSAAVLSEYATFEILSFSTSYLSTAHLAAQSVLTTISIVSWHVPFSVSVVSSTRIGHLVGARQPRVARDVATIHGLAFVGVGCMNAMITIIFRKQLPQIFTRDVQTLDICTRSILAVAVFQIAEGIMCGMNGLLRGLGRQLFSACVVFVVNYMGAVPLALWLQLGSPGWGLNGFWLGLPIGMAVISCVEAIYMRFIRWDKCVEMD